MAIIDSHLFLIHSQHKSRFDWSKNGRIVFVAVGNFRCEGEREKTCEREEESWPKNLNGFVLGFHFKICNSHFWFVAFVRSMEKTTTGGKNVKKNQNKKTKRNFFNVLPSSDTAHELRSRGSETGPDRKMVGEKQKLRKSLFLRRTTGRGGSHSAGRFMNMQRPRQPTHQKVSSLSQLAERQYFLVLLEQMCCAWPTRRGNASAKDETG